MNIVTIIQARLGSTRLPGKVLLDIAGKPMLRRVYDRAAQAGTDKVVIATSVEAADDPVAEYCAQHRLPCFRGHHTDVLKRCHDAAADAKADVVVRITADCPLLDPSVTRRTIDAFLAGSWDYVSNVHPPSFPDGLDTEIFSMEALRKAHTEAVLPSHREHVTFYFTAHPELLRLHSIRCDRDLSHNRWTVDKEQDLRFVRTVYERMRRDDFHMEDVLQLVAQDPALSDLNAGIERNEGHRKAFEADREFLAGK